MSLGRTIKQYAVEHGYEQAIATFNEARKQGKISDSQLSLRDLAESFLGDNWATKLGKMKTGDFLGLEAADAVDASAFVSITGNQLIETIQSKYKSPEFIGDQLVTKIPVTNGNLSTIREPWLSGVQIENTSGTSFITEQGMPFGRTEFSPNYVLLAAPQKRGLICDVTFEMIYSDRTRQAIDSAGNVGYSIGLAREYNIARVVLGITNNFTVSFGGAAEQTLRTYNSTALSAGSIYYINHLVSTPLTGWADVNSVEQLFSEMRDPVTGVPIITGAKQMLVMPANWYNARNILHATQIRVGDGASLATATYSDNPLQAFSLLNPSPHFFKVADDELTVDGSTAITTANTKTVWYVGDFPAAFYYREVHPLQVQQAPVMNPAEFERDIALSVRAKEYGVAGVRNAFHVARAITTSTTTA